MKQKTVLYRAYDANDQLLYIGISHQVLARFDQHAHTNEWQHECSYVILEHFPFRRLALAAEKIAIKNENPKYNQIHKRKQDEARNLSAKTQLRV